MSSLAKVEREREVVAANVEVHYKMTTPPNLSKETLSVWDGWSKMGEREVVRESSAKGSHIDLVYTFLSQRKQLPVEKIKLWFQQEVIEWATELLKNKQIFRASHILKNISLDPFDEITQIMLNTTDSTNRNFLASHLEKNKRLDCDTKLHLELFNIIEKDMEALNDFKHFNELDVTLRILLDCDKEWKSNMVAKLFLKYYDFTLSPLLTANSLWSCALESNHKPFLKNWVEIQYSSTLPLAEEDELTILLTDLRITEEMFNGVVARDVSDEIKEFVYDATSHYGIFNYKEVNDIKGILVRTTRNQLNENLKDILSMPTSNLSFDNFQLLLKDFCVQHNLYVVLDACLQEDIFLQSLHTNETHETSTQTLQLLKSCKEVSSNLNNRQVLATNLQEIKKYLNQTVQTVHGDVDSLLDLFLMQMEGLNVHKTISDGTMNNLPTLKTIANKLLANPTASCITRYDILRQHLNLDVDKLFRHRQPTTNVERPHFKSIALSDKYGRRDQIDYVFYVVHCRPSKAANLLLELNDNMDDFDLHNVATAIRKVAIKNFNREDIVVSCICFLENVNIESAILKIEIHAANLLVQTPLSTVNIQDLFLTGRKDKIIHLYETAVFANNETRDFVDNMRHFEFVITLAKSYGCRLPEMYLEQLATESKWMEFLIVIQKFEYPQEQVSLLVTNFTDFALYDHLSHALSHDLVFEPKNVLKDRDARKFFLARIGLLKHVETDTMSSITSQSSWGSNTSSSGLSDYISDIDCATEQKSNLLQVLLKCHNSNDPPKALLYACQHYKYPLFAVLATTYEPDSVVTCWLTWLSVSCGIDVENCEKLAVVGHEVTDFLRNVLDHGYYKTLRQSLSIFLLDNPLKIFVEFLCDCKNLNFSICQQQNDLKSFHKKMKQKRSYSYVLEVDHEMIYLNNKMWIETTSITLLATTLNNLRDKPYARVQLIQILMDLDLQKFFFKRLPNLSTLYDLFSYFYEYKMDVSIDFNKLFDVNGYHDEIKSCISEMLAECKYDEALKVAQLENVLIDEVLVKKWGQEIEDSEDYWLRCDKEFRKYSISPEMAVMFYQSTTVNDDLLKYKILMIAYVWCSQFKLAKHNQIELEMWQIYILKLNNSTNVPLQIDLEKNKSYLEMKTDLETITMVNDSELSTNETKKLDEVIDKLLNAGSIFQALRLQRLFTNYGNVNLDIFKLSYSLAEGLTVPIQLTARERLLIRKVKNNRSYSHRRKTLFSFRLSSSASASRSPASSFGAALEVEPNVQDTISLLENLIEGLTSGTDLAERIVMTYRISINTEISYNNILSIEEPLALLLNAVNSNCSNKIEVAHDFFCIYNWNKQQIADFLCEQLINAVSTCTKSPVDNYTMWNINLDQEVHLVLQLLPDACSVLGNKLYSYSSALHKAQTITNETPKMDELTIVIELLVLSHDCYTSDCNMEGISIILKKCQTLINLLLALKNWALIVRLLTGVGRYNELNYVFHILRENDQFEYLLRKGSAKDNGLRVALLDYLKKFCPDNRELYEMVALYFSLYSEVAHIWEKESEHAIRNLVAISKLEMINRKTNPDECIFVELSNTEGTRLCLKKAMENYSHAAEYHLQGEKLAKAMNAARQAELIALQSSLVRTGSGTTNCILNLTTLQIAALISTLTFQQAIIVTEAYSFQTDWALTLFEHFIVKNDHKYFDNYLMTYNLTDSVVHNLSRHFLAKNVMTEHGTRNMKTILQLLPSIHTKYRIASELGLSDIVEDLLNGDKLNYLKDTVWKRGYRQ